MGLDMYLEKRTYVKNWDWMKSEDRHQISVQRGGHPTEIKPERISHIIEQVAYWRKANAIHQWFVDNVQRGNDDCKEYYVQAEQLQDLLSLCTQVLNASELVDGEIANGYTVEDGKKIPIVESGKTVKNPSTAQQLLPTQEGFFFGSTDYDQWYIDDIKYTKDTLEKVLAEEPCGDYYYSSSW
jgi:hypothetical protein